MIKLNVAEIKRRLVGKKTFAYDLAPDELEITSGDMDVIGTVRAEGCISNAGDVLLLEAELSAQVRRTCGRCLAACPTKALTPGVVDANRCISYNTIERKDAVPLGLKPLMAGYLFGCDVCQDVCPWNRKAVPHRDAAFRPDDGLLNMTREDWLALDEAAFRERFARSPLSRPGLRHLQELLR